MPGPCLPGLAARPCPHSLEGEACSWGLGRCCDSTQPHEGESCLTVTTGGAFPCLTWLVKWLLEYCKISYNNLLRRNCPSHNVVSTMAGDVQTWFCCPTGSGEEIGTLDEGIHPLYQPQRPMIQYHVRQCAWLSQSLGYQVLPSSSYNLFTKACRPPYSKMEPSWIQLQPTMGWDRDAVWHQCCSTSTHASSWSAG